MDFAEFIGANRHTIAIAQSYFGGVSVDIRFRLKLTGLPSTVAIGGFASAKQCHLKTRYTVFQIFGSEAYFVLSENTVYREQVIGST